MSKIVASYLIKVTLRQEEEATDTVSAPTLDHVEAVIEQKFAEAWPELEVNARAERTDT